MRATVMYGAGDVRIEDVPDAHLIDPTDALVRVTRAAICGSDLWPYKPMEQSDAGRRMGHEFIGVVEAVGDDVRTVKAGDLVVVAVPVVGRHLRLLPGGPAHARACMAAGTASTTSTAARARPCAFRRRTARSSSCRSSADDALMPSLLTLSDVMGTGHHAAVEARVAPGKRRPSSATAPSASAA